LRNTLQADLPRPLLTKEKTTSFFSSSTSQASVECQLALRHWVPEVEGDGGSQREQASAPTFEDLTPWARELGKHVTQRLEIQQNNHKVPQPKEEASLELSL
jgi:hypothetical protein